MLLGLRTEAQFVDMVDDVAQRVAAVDLVLDLAEDFSDLVFERIGPAGFFPEAVQVGEQRLLDELDQVGTGHRGVVVDLAVLVLRRGPGFPTVRLVEQVAVFLAFELRFHRLAVFQLVEILQEQQPRGLLGVVQLGGAARFLAQVVVDIPEGLFKHGYLRLLNSMERIIETGKDYPC